MGHKVETTRNNYCPQSAPDTKIPEGFENPRERVSDLEVGWVPQGGALCILGIPNGAVLGCTRRTVWWRERRGVGKAEVPGELTSEGNRPKGDAPV